MALILYQRDHCHLCDLALGELAKARAPEFESVFIDGDDARDIELDWPFDAEKLRGFLAP